jgi:two-component sensor histidine kinase/CheY-like chemotaxis protein
MADRLLQEKQISPNNLLVYKILLIEDDESDIFFVRTMLQEISDFRFQLDIVGRIEDALTKFKNGAYDIILMDLNLPDKRGLESLQSILQTDEAVPVVVISGLEDKALAIKAIQDGAQDYLVKWQITGSLLWRVICYAIERKKTEAVIRASLNEKEILLKEIHHRVKNNLQVISSLLNLQSRFIIDSRDFKIFQESQNRIRSIAMIHEKLYKSDDFNHIDFSGYIENLSHNLCHSYKVDSNRIKITIEVKNVELGIDKAVPCALIINELLSNAILYAFPETFEGKPEITIRFFKNTDSGSRLSVSDNGVGLPPDFDFRKTESLGLYLVRIITEEQLGGKLHVQSQNGTHFTIELPF